MTGAHRCCYKERGSFRSALGGNAVAAWVATIDDGAVRNTRDINILLREKDLDRAAELIQGVRVLYADCKIRPDLRRPPRPSHSE